MAINTLTVNKILRKMARKERLTHSEELFCLIEILNFSEERAEQMMIKEYRKLTRKLKMSTPPLATAA